MVFISSVSIKDLGFIICQEILHSQCFWNFGVGQ